MQDKGKEKSKLVRTLSKVSAIFRGIVGKRRKLNQKMQGWYTPRRIGIYSVIAVCIIWILLLFLPPYLGVADDGSLYKVMDRIGISYMVEDSEYIYNNYFIKEYLIESSPSIVTRVENSQDLFIKGAIFIDGLFTRDQYFDIRFLAFIYGILFMPSIYVIIKQACMRVSNFSEAIVIGILGVFIFGDISYLTYFSSLYPEAVWIICLMYCCGAIFKLQKRKGSFFSMLLFTLIGVVFSTSRQQCGIIGFLLAGFCIRAVFLNKNIPWRIYCVCMAFILSLTGMASLYTLESDFNVVSEYHSMTRGVLFQAADPEKALKEFGINSSYSVLANTSAYDYYPVVSNLSEQLYEGFYDKYTPYDIALFYVKHPGAFINMMDLAVKGTSNLRRSFCGNYEKNYGMPKMAQSIFWSGWSIFKERSLPKTIGYLVVLLICGFAFFGKRLRKNRLIKENENTPLMMEAILIIAGIGISQAAISIIMSGDAEFSQHAFLFGASMDLIVYFIMAELLGRLNILQEGEVKSIGTESIK